MTDIRGNTDLTKDMATMLAGTFRGYRARHLHGHWIVWCDRSDHVVEFDPSLIEQARIATQADEE
jgi:hypothetical protein